ncbi:hypothetical protein [Acinetobacter wuhouensis]|uniref:Uncharacterized protein n=1 Tax=Acinetobacter wuhouensis TaxID=1879050 RepID=A0A4Q7AG07_9GAMM|nr:hypothetical protein [Acinetobacter wuhouensis]RZG45813.1 hypothetical protein EXU28_11390 [Acinetobacter wuhouensis]
MILIVYSSLSIGRIQAQLLENQQSTASIRYQFVQPQHFEMKAELDGGCYKGNQDLLSAEIHRKKVKPEYLQKIILENKRTRSAFTAMTFIFNGQPISMNVLDDAFTAQYCTNGTNIPVFIQGDIVNLSRNGVFEQIYFVRKIKLF